jgi:hypothetical protein
MKRKPDEIIILKNIPKFSLNEIWNKTGKTYYKLKKFKDEIHKQLEAQDTGLRVSKPCHLVWYFIFATKPLDSTNCCLMKKAIEDFFVPQDDYDIVQFSSDASRKSEAGEDSVQLHIHYI